MPGAKLSQCGHIGDGDPNREHDNRQKEQSSKEEVEDSHPGEPFARSSPVHPPPRRVTIDQSFKGSGYDPSDWNANKNKQQPPQGGTRSVRVRFGESQEHRNSKDRGAGDQACGPDPNSVAQLHTSTQKIADHRTPGAHGPIRPVDPRAAVTGRLRSRLENESRCVSAPFTGLRFARSVKLRAAQTGDRTGSVMVTFPLGLQVDATRSGHHAAVHAAARCDNKP